MPRFPASAAARRARRRVFYVTLIVLIIFFADILSGGAMRALVRAGAAQLWRVGAGAAAAVGNSGFFSSRAALARENEALRAQLQSLQLRAAAYEFLADENRSLTSLVRLAERGVGLTAPVVSSTWSSPYGTFLIGAGTADGVHSGDLVLAGSADERGIVIGRVRDAGARTSLVEEVLAPGATIEGSLRGARVSVEGKGGGNGYAKLPRGVEAAEGDAVRAPSLGGRAIAFVGKITGDAASAYQDVYLAVPLNLGELSYVYVTSN